MASNFSTAELPKPVVVAELDFEATFQARLQDFVGRMIAAGVDFDQEMLETDPAVIAAQSAAYADMHFVARLNDMARTAILPSFAQGSDLDLHVQRTGIRERAAGESDAAVRQRIRLYYKSKSAAGADDYYIAKAFETDPRVKDVAVTVVTRNASERVLILSVPTSDNGGEADTTLLTKLELALNDPSFKARNVAEVDCIPAVIVIKPVTATIYLYPQGVQPADGAKPLRDAFALDQRLGFDLTRSYVEKYLHQGGVQRVELVGWTDANAAANQAIRLGDIVLNFVRLTS